MRTNTLCLIFPIFMACHAPAERPGILATVKDSAGRVTNILTPTDGTPQMNDIRTGKTTPAELISFARTAIGIPYKYASTDPAQGFDCSGFITYVFSHFGIAVPRTSSDFTNVNHEIPLKDAKPGDLILFTGTDSSIRTVGHMGIIVSSQGEAVTFIHATSGKAKGVIETLLNAGYRQRYVKTLRIFAVN